MKNHLSKLLILTITTLSISSCSYRPILDHNDKYNAVGEEKADVDIKICKNMYLSVHTHLKTYVYDHIKKQIFNYV